MYYTNIYKSFYLSLSIIVKLKRNITIENWRRLLGKSCNYLLCLHERSKLYYMLYLHTYVSGNNLFH